MIRLLARNFPALDVLPRALQDWPSLNYGGFVAEVRKALRKVKGPALTLAEELAWESVFEGKRAEVLDLRAEILRLDREIDVAVYKLYGLSWEEVRIIDPGFWMGEGE